MLNIVKTLTAFALLMSLAVAPNLSLAGETDALTDLLKQVDKQVCQSPKKIMGYYAKDTVIISDDKRVLPEHRIKDYEVMIAELQGMKCNNKRTVLAGHAGKNLGYLLVDELISVSSRHGVIDTAKRNGGAMQVAFGSVIEHHVENHLNTRLMKRPHPTGQQ